MGLSDLCSSCRVNSVAILLFHETVLPWGHDENVFNMAQGFGMFMDFCEVADNPPGNIRPLEGLRFERPEFGPIETDQNKSGCLVWFLSKVRHVASQRCLKMWKRLVERIPQGISGLDHNGEPRETSPNHSFSLYFAQLASGGNRLETWKRKIIRLHAI